MESVYTLFPSNNCLFCKHTFCCVNFSFLFAFVCAVSEAEQKRISFYRCCLVSLSMLHISQRSAPLYFQAKSNYKIRMDIIIIQKRIAVVIDSKKSSKHQKTSKTMPMLKIKKGKKSNLSIFVRSVYHLMFSLISFLFFHFLSKIGFVCERTLVIGYHFANF